MLVLSRRSNERIVFPTLDILLQVLQIKGNTVRLGIEAPPEVTIFRDEVTGHMEAAAADPKASRESIHAVCNRLSKVTLSLYLFEQQWRAGRTDEARATLARVFDLLGAMDREWLMSQFTGALPPPPPKTRKFRMLVVEDDSNQRELLAGMLAMNGCECHTAVDGAAALDFLASNERPDLVLLDMWMPRCDGPRTIRQLRGNPRYAGMKVFSISSTSPQEAGLSTGPDGVDAWFPKPLNPHKLWEGIQAGMAATAG
jgi:carbon storage regulator CsrA